MPTNLLGAVVPGVEYARVTEEEQKKTSVHAQRQPALQHLKTLVTFWEICIFTFFYPKLDKKIDSTLSILSYC